MWRMIHGHKERGATAVVVALVLVVLVGFGALAVDISVLWWDKKQVQNGADAAALALAQGCATAGGCDLTKDEAEDRYVKRNKNDLNARIADIQYSSGSVRVVVDTQRDNALAPVLGIDSSHVDAVATASWGSPRKVVALPLATSTCWFQYQTGSSAGSPPSTTDEFIIPLKSKTNAVADGAMICGTHAAHNETAGGFGWLQPTSGCEVTIDLADPWVDVYSGSAIPTGCVVSTALQPGDTVLMPLFDQWRGTGTNAEYHVYVFAALEVTGYCFGSHNSSAPGWPSCQDLAPNPDKGQNVRGRFVEMVELEDVLEYGGPTAPNAGVVGVRLTE